MKLYVVTLHGKEDCLVSVSKDIPTIYAVANNFSAQLVTGPPSKEDLTAVLMRDLPGLDLAFEGCAAGGTGRGANKTTMTGTYSVSIHEV